MSSRERVDRAVAFVDLAGFTALTQTHGDEYAADVHEAFLGAVDAACELTGQVECVKHLGDGAMLVAPRADRMLTALVEGVAARHDEELSLRVRAGLHFGPVLRLATAHGSDYLGHTVNVAARLAGAAAPGQLLVSAAAAAGAMALRPDLRSAGTRELRHVREPIEVWALDLDTHARHLDPVCHMTVHEGELFADRDGSRWWFCSPLCREQFQRPGSSAPETA